MAIFNMVGGGGGLIATDAILRVIAPAGSTVTISKGGVSKSDAGHENAADNTLYDYYFIIHASQFDSTAWTVTATLGTLTNSTTVIIDSANEYDVTIVYTLWLVKDGVSQVGELTRVGKKSSSSSSATETQPGLSYQTGYIQIGWTQTSSSAQAGIAYLPNQIDLTPYSSIHVDGTVYNSTTQTTNAALQVWTSIGSYQDSNRLHIKGLGSLGTSFVAFNHDVDITSDTVSAYIGFNAYRTSSAYTTIRLANLYLEV